MMSPQVTLTAGGRCSNMTTRSIGFFGFGRNPGGNFTDKPFNGAGSSHSGVIQCFTVAVLGSQMPLPRVSTRR